ncbi:hypothetical protein ACWCPM_10535 [Streptomyces sp. NPDC002309]
MGTSPAHGESILEALPRVGCVFTDDRHWWWVVPSGSHLGITWPPSTTYVIGARMGDPSWTASRPRPGTSNPRLLHAPVDGSPYTPPLPLYFLTCRLTGSSPRWSLGEADRRTTGTTYSPDVVPVSHPPARAYTDTSRRAG